MNGYSKSSGHEGYEKILQNLTTKFLLFGNQMY